MNEMNLPENQLRSWRPRRPSAKLESRLFGGSRSGPQIPDWPLRWIGPTAACTLAAILMGHHRQDFGGQRVEPLPLMAGVGSNGIVSVAGDYQPEWNTVSPRTFEWTNLSASTSSITSFRRAQ